MDGVPHPIVEDELEQLDRVTRRLAARPQEDTASEAPIVRELGRLREQILSRGHTSDGVALRDQFHRQSSLLRHMRETGDAPRVDPASPYFAHLRLREDGRELSVRLILL